MMTRDIRMSGYDPQRTAGAGFDFASSSSLQFKADLDGDGDFTNSSSPPGNDPNEQVRYALTNDHDNNGVADGFPCSLGREAWSGNLQPAADDIEALNFVYLDDDGNVIPAPVSAGDLSKIRSIEITLVARAEKRDKDYTSTTEIRNMRGTLIHAAPGDGYRRHGLSFTIQCRNMGL
jgi:type IV pilus assembly protein PilW